jgi:hypothetical protein
LFSTLFTHAACSAAGFHPKEIVIMLTRKLFSAALVAATLGSSPLVFGQTAFNPSSMVAADGIVKVRSAYGMDETIARIKDDIARKGIMSFPPSTRRSSPRMRASSCRRRRC